MYELQYGKISSISFPLLGKLPKLETPCCAFIRLTNAVVIEHIAEVCLPARFIFVYFGPDKKGMGYVEVGRSISTLLTNPVSEAAHTLV